MNENKAEGNGNKAGAKASPGMIAAAVALALVFAFGAWFVLRQADRSRADIPVYGTVPPFEFVDQDSVAFGSEQMKGEVNLVDFIFTNCKTACPIMAREGRKFYEAFREAEDFRIVSISVDPARDTLAALRAYRDEQGVTDDRWVFLRAPVDSVIKLSEEGFFLPAEGLPMGHATRYVLVDRQNRIRGYYNALEGKPMMKLMEDLKQVLREEPGAGEGLEK
jgi:protein SCO1/2